MIIVMQNWRDIPARVITNVSDAMFLENEFVWRIGRSKEFNHRISLDRLESQYTFAYIMGDKMHRFGSGNALKWLVWKNVLVSDFTDAAMVNHIKRNPANG